MRLPTAENVFNRWLYFLIQRRACRKSGSQSMFMFKVCILRNLTICIRNSMKWITFHNLSKLVKSVESRFAFASINPSREVALLNAFWVIHHTHSPKCQPNYYRWMREGNFVLTHSHLTPSPIGSHHSHAYFISKLYASQRGVYWQFPVSLFRLCSGFSNDESHWALNACTDARSMRLLIYKNNSTLRCWTNTHYF